MQAGLQHDAELRFIAHEIIAEKTATGERKGDRDRTASQHRWQHQERTRLTQEKHKGLD